MKKLTLIITLFLFQFNTTFSQTENIMQLDSLFQQIENTSNDTSKLRRYFNLYLDYQMVLCDKIDEIINHNLQKSISENNKLLESYCYYISGKKLINNNNYSKAIEYLIKANNIANKLSYSELRRDIYFDISICYEKLNNYQLAFQNYLLFNSLSDSIILAKNNQLKDRFIRKIETNNLIMLRNLGKDILERKKGEVNSIIFEGILVGLIIVLIIISLYHKRRAGNIIKIKNKESNCDWFSDCEKTKLNCNTNVAVININFFIFNVFTFVI